MDSIDEAQFLEVVRTTWSRMAKTLQSHGISQEAGLKLFLGGVAAGIAAGSLAQVDVSAALIERTGGLKLDGFDV